MIPDPDADPLGRAVTAIADLYAAMAIDEAFAAELRAQAAAPDRAPRYHEPYDV